MSKGLGRIERDILAIMQREPKEFYTSLRLAVEVYRIALPDIPITQEAIDYWRGFRFAFSEEQELAIAARMHAGRLQHYAETRLVTAAQHSAVRRGLASLKRKGLVLSSPTRKYQRSVRQWALASQPAE